jgi:excisionase family DNA binding protein
VPRPSTTLTDADPPTPTVAELVEAGTIFVSVKDAAAMLGLSKNQTYDLLNEGVIESRYFRRRRLIPLDSLHAFAEGLPTEREAG